MNSTRFVFLDCLRIFAATSVFFGHNLSGFLQSVIDSDELHQSHKFYWNIAYLIRFLTEKGGTGVIIFFMISGYIITHTLQFSSANSFLIRRFFRIYPVFIFASILEVSVSGQRLSYSDLVWRMLLMGDLVELPYGLGGVEWTLRIELYFYLFMYLLKSIGVIYSKHLSMVFIIPALYLFFSDPLPRYGPFSGYISLYISILFMGSCVYIAQHDSRSRMISIGTFFLLYMIHVQELINLEKGSMYFRFLNIGMVIWFTSWYFQKLFYPSFFISLFSNITYSFYLLHNWIGGHISIYVFQTTWPWSVYILIVIISILLYYSIEVPFILLGRRFSRDVFGLEQRRFVP